MTINQIAAAIPAIEAELSPEAVADARFESAFPVNGHKSDRALRAYHAELARLWNRAEAERRLNVYRAHGIKAFHAAGRRELPTG